MEDVIKLLPDHVANQIAAGEVIQRPASAVKELLENAIDAGATTIQLIIKEGGRSLIRVVDNGKGMSHSDTRMAFERHATSKIRSAEDLWQIKSMGFRGEALATIAAIARVEVKTCQIGSELGTHLSIEGSEVKLHQHTACPPGTSISMKDIFYNVPARRNFLKNNSIETRHIYDEFQRVALAHPEVQFSLINNEEEVYRLMSGNLKQRIIGLLGNNLNERLITIKEESPLINISGFIVKPEFSKKTRGDQYFFINKRFIKSNYLHHAVSSAMEDLMQPDTHPIYFLMMETDPAFIDINIHPTKTEVKFQDDKSVYAILRSAVRKAIGSFTLSPRLDFDYKQAFDIPLPLNREIKAPEIVVNPDYNPFSNPRPGNNDLNTIGQNRWEMLAGLSTETSGLKQESIPGLAVPANTKPWLLHNAFICSQVKSGLMMIDVTGARERIAFERFMQKKNAKSAAQRLLFPVTKEFNAPEYQILEHVWQELQELGFEIETFGQRTIIIQAVPVELSQMEPGTLIDELIQAFTESFQELKLNKRESVAKQLARAAARKKEHFSNEEQMNSLIHELFACEQPTYGLKANTIVHILTLEEIKQRFSS
jgi:DNA mismatch repair protein MutL